MGRNRNPEILVTVHVKEADWKLLHESRRGTEPIHETLNRILDLFRKDKLDLQLECDQRMRNIQAMQKEILVIRKENDELKAQRDILSYHD